MKLQSILFLPLLTFAGQYSGVVTNLSGGGIAGVLISSNGFTATSDAQGNWSLGGVNGIASKLKTTVPVSRNLVMENGHIGL